jgi:multicomponent Na+:H+ antiporter subunit C
MTVLTCIMIGVLFAASVYLMLGGELKEVFMGIFMLGHGANLAVLVSSRSPIGRVPPVLTEGIMLEQYVDPLPQALILTAIVIGFAVQAFLLTMLVVTWRRSRTLDLDELAGEE